MIKLKNSKLILLFLLFSSISSPNLAGQLYRFQDENNTPAVSRNLPPYAVQKGYDILDDKSLRLIKRVPPALTNEQIIQQEQDQAAQKEALRLAEIAAKKQQAQKKQQAIYNKNLLARYQSESELLKSRDADLTYRQTELKKATEYLASNKQKLRQLQQHAAEQELSGHEMSVNLSKDLTSTQQEIANNIDDIGRLQAEFQQLSKQYATELTQLQKLLAERNN